MGKKVRAHSATMTRPHRPMLLTCPSNYCLPNYCLPVARPPHLATSDSVCSAQAGEERGQPCVRDGRGRRGSRSRIRCSGEGTNRSNCCNGVPPLWLQQLTAARWCSWRDHFSAVRLGHSAQLGYRGSRIAAKPSGWRARPARPPVQATHRSSI